MRRYGLQEAVPDEVLIGRSSSLRIALENELV
jgi:hypothetical protein